MKILLISRDFEGGGAAHACRRLFEALCSSGADVRLLLLNDPETEHERISSIQQNLWDRLLARAYFAGERLEILAHSRGRKRYLWRASTASLGFDVSNHPWVRWADVLHLHWINQGYLSLTGLRRLALLGKPIVWTLHDLWPATGLCHLPLSFGANTLTQCPSYTTGCGACPLLSSSRPSDLSAEICQEKAFLAEAPFHYIAVSHREAELFSQSSLMQGQRAIVIPPPIDIDVYRRCSDLPMPSWHDPSRQYLLIAAARLDDSVKGFELLREITLHLQSLNPEMSERVTLLLAGRVKTACDLNAFGIDTRMLGAITKIEEMIQLYQLANLTLSTSLFETFGQTLTEALASGCPVVSFKSFGPEDIIQDGKNGYLVEAYDTRLFAEKILKALEQDTQHAMSREACRGSVAHLSTRCIAEQHLEFYKRIAGAMEL
ncbi:MAG: glycosyltransferase [Porphyromonadaceae bacterium]|nr:glycosyltransferase [Porphyromonadaceae bacterium]